MKAALDDAGALPADATDEEIEQAYIDFEVSKSKGAVGPIGEPGPIGVDGVDGAYIPTEEETQPVTPPAPPAPIEDDDDLRPVAERLSGNPEYQSVIKAANSSLGDKDPEVIAWCRANLSESDFSEKYAGRKI